MKTEKELLQVRVTVDDKRKWQVQAAFEGLSLSQWVRARCNKEQPRPTLEDFLAKQREKHAAELEEARQLYMATMPAESNPFAGAPPVPDAAAFAALCAKS